MKAKYNMTLEQNIFVAKRNIVDYIYNSAKLEGCNVTFPETQTILDGINVGSVTLDDIRTILNMRDAWRFVLSNMTQPFDLDYLCKINGYVSYNESLEWGVLRKGSVGISGTKYRPKIPDETNVRDELEGFWKVSSATKRAIDFFLWGCRSQLFWDGNKRSSTLGANRILIEAGEGVFTVRDQDIFEFNKRLLVFYDTGEPSEFDKWLYEHCIDGLDFENDK
jgi:hypothetical protein